jgi:hypothetical protein
VGDQTDVTQSQVNNDLDRWNLSDVFSTISASLAVPTAETDVITASITEFNSAERTRDLGTFSRLLLFALERLREKHEVHREPHSRTYVTKYELRSAHSRPFLMRKIYITPSTIFYEGPYHEEKCAAIRLYENEQDQFLRVSFRDEGKLT